MSVSWGHATNENVARIIELAKNRKNGVHKARGIAFRVIEGRVTHYSNLKGAEYEIIQSAGHFCAVIGKAETYRLASIELKKLA